MPVGVVSRRVLSRIGIRDDLDLSAWALRHGLLSAFIRFSAARRPFPACWQVIHPGHVLAQGPSWQRGAKTFIVRDLEQKRFAEELARDWAISHFDNSAPWLRIEGLNDALFSHSVADELRLHIPDLVVYQRRQESSREALARRVDTSSEVPQPGSHDDLQTTAPAPAPHRG